MTEEAQVVPVLDEMSWVDIAAHLARDPRLIIPIGALEQHGPHLPLGANTRIATRIAHSLAARWRVLCAPTVNYGVNHDGGQPRAGRAWAGTASLRRKTMHRALNELLDSWESHGIAEFILITAHRHGPHIDALTTLMTRAARVRVVSVWDVDVSDLLDSQPGPQHAGEAETSLMLHLCPGRVAMDRARDEPPRRSERNGESPPRPRPDGPGNVGYPTLATAATGARIFERMLEIIGRAVFAARETADSDTL
jgi:creatinine amidohydrolase